MPIAINTSRMPSSATTSVANNPITSTVPSRPATTSRRGGLTGSRSPVGAMMGGTGGAGSPTGGVVQNRLGGSPTMGSPDAVSMGMSSPNNPSSAAAAAAAAAAATSYTSGGGGGRWKAEDPIGVTSGDPYTHHSHKPYGMGHTEHHQNHQQHPHHPPPQHHHPSSYGYENRGGLWHTGDDTYNSVPRRRPDNAANSGGNSTHSRHYHYDPYSRSGGGTSAIPHGYQASMGPPGHNDLDARYSSHPSGAPPNRNRYEHPYNSTGGSSRHPPPYHRPYDSRHQPHGGPPPPHHPQNSSHHQHPSFTSSSTSHGPTQHTHVYAPQDFAQTRYASSVRGERGDHRPHSRQSDASISHSIRGERGPPPLQPSLQDGPKGPRSSPSGGGMSLVIGGTTPIHLPKPSSSPTDEAMAASPKTSASSGAPAVSVPGSADRLSSRAPQAIFRDRHSDASKKPPSSRTRMSEHHDKQRQSDAPNGEKVHDVDKIDANVNKDDDDSPQNILLSLRTPTTSFEENVSARKSSGTAKNEEKNLVKSRLVDPTNDEDTIQRKNSNSNATNRKQERSHDQVYENQSSNDLLKPNGSIDMAPSFNFMNASFDSLTDGPYFTLDSTLGHTESFGLMGRNDSIGGDQTQILRRNSSSGNYSAQILATNSGPEIGYSPVNSFGATMGGYRLSSSHEGGSIMLVGESPENPASDRYGSINQYQHNLHNSADEMYRTYSTGAGSRDGLLDDSHLRMSVGSFGYSRSYGDPASPGESGLRSHDNLELHHPTHRSRNPYHGVGLDHYGMGHTVRTQSFYVLLVKFRAAFKGCTFLLPGLKVALLKQGSSEDGNPNGKEAKSRWDHKHRQYEHPGQPTSLDTAIARRRVECSVCAFGGSTTNEHSMPYEEKEKNSHQSARNSIFREKDSQQQKQTPTITPSSTEITARAVNEHSLSRSKYEEKLAGRYYENESRLSWEFEEEPPIEVPEHTSEFPTLPQRDSENELDEDDDDDYNSAVNGPDNKEENSKTKTDQPESSEQESNRKENEQSGEGDLLCKEVSESAARKSPSPTPSRTKEDRSGSLSPQAKMKYRCKLCGQPKQNHRCPYQQSLARSIGVMVYPAVNAFTADEPGTIAAPLSEMNNFVDIQKQESQLGDSSVGGVSAEVTPDRGTHGPVGVLSTTTGTVVTSTMVSPDSLRSNNNTTRSTSSHQQATYDGSSQAQTSGLPQPLGQPSSYSHSHHGLRSADDNTSQKKRGYSQIDNPTGNGHTEGRSSNHQEDLLFLDAIELKPEQFRVVSQSSDKILSSVDAFKYPLLPLPFAQRKRLSDNLFSLSNEVPKLTDECAQVLREAREKDMWDLAVAELMTQVIIVLHCSTDDFRLEGLRQYLLTLGIAC